LIISKSFVDILSSIFADIPFANEDALKEKCEQTKLLLPEIILSQLLTAGNLISNIHGVEYITNVFDKNKKVSKKPNIFMANCSLSKIYAKEETKRKFESVLWNLNPTNKDVDPSRKISICVFPKVSFKGDDDETNPIPAVWESDDEQADESTSQEIGDETGFSDFAEYLEYCSQKDLKIMNFISLDQELADLRDTAFDDNNENSLTHFVKKLRNKVSAESLKHVSICIPDSIFLPSLEYNFFGKISKTAVISIKGAFMVASIVMRNDHYEIIKVLLKNNVKNKGYTAYIQRQPGIGIGPDKTWREKILSESFAELFEFEDISTYRLDQEIMDELFNKDTLQNNTYSFLHHSKGKKIKLKSFNTAYTDDNDRPVSVNSVRVEDYLKMILELNNSLTDEEFKKMKKDEGGMRKYNEKINYINAL
jgi:hypothetical protein